MRAVLALIALMVTAGSAAGENPYAAAGISNPANVTQFVARLKQAMAADDRAAVAAMVNYPMTVHASGGASVTYRDAASLRSRYAQIFTPDAMQIKQLVAYVLSIDEDEQPFTIPAKGAKGGDLCFYQ